MRILMVTAELAPLAKTGGLGDAVAGLSGALAARGHDVRVLLPRYAHLLSAAPSLAAAERAAAVALVDLGDDTGTGVYLGDARDARRFLKLAAAARDYARVSGWAPDLLHCHDWHAALVPDLLRAAGLSTPTVLTLHNIGYQGVFDASVLAATPGLSEAVSADARADGRINFLRAGVRSATALTTVSPTYAAEIRTPAYGMGLEVLLEERHADLSGILNGVDYETWSPESDPLLEVHYDGADITPKYQIKKGLCARLGLAFDRNAPLLGLVGRLTPQKGIDLVTAAMPQLLADTRATFAVLGSGDAGLASELERLAAAHPRRVAAVIGYDEALAHRILAGSDLALVPSRYEPCGLTQMYALRYGTIPVVRATGGLADTVAHFDPATGNGNGSVFRDPDPAGLLWGIRTALGWFDQPSVWPRIIGNAMRADFSWDRQVRDYERLYRALVER